MDFSKTTFSWSRSLTDYSKVQWLISKVRRNNSLFMPEVPPGSYLNVGCGPNILSGFLNVDFSWRPGVDLCCDITRPFPISDARIGGIYTEHCLEHLTLRDARKFLAECLRMLVPGAGIRIVVPDLEMYARSYVDRLEGRESKLPNEFYVDSLGVNRPVALINELFYGPDHRFIYDYRTLAEVLTQIGFAKVDKVSIGKGSDGRLLVDDPGHVSESLYVEAWKE